MQFNEGLQSPPQETTNPMNQHDQFEESALYDDENQYVPDTDRGARKQQDEDEDLEDSLY
tara:strand:- start:163 stop:342 length:180 start_codon:yes stop_codon:yes gene_type:complete